MSNGINPAPEAIPSSATSIPTVRPGISSETLQRLKIRHVNAAEALELLGINQPGIYIPFEGETYRDKEGKTKPYGRLRLDTPGVKMKYFQPKGSEVHNYVLPDLALYNGDLLMVEGEFKAISLHESGFPAIGTSGFHSWGSKQEISGRKGATRIVLEAAFARALDTLKPKRIIYVGDPDTALNTYFTSAMVKLASTTGLPVSLFRIEYAAPDGKGVDDIREKLGDAKFRTWFQHGLDTAMPVPAGIDSHDLFFTLIERERHSLLTLKGADQSKAQKRMVNSAILLSELQREKLATLAKELLGLSKVTFKKAVREREIEAEKERRANRPPTPISNKGVLHSFCMIGEEFYSYSYRPDPNSKSKKLIRSETMSVCSKDYVHQSLYAAGYCSDEPSTADTPVCGAVPNLSRFHAALHYLNATRCVGTIDQLYRPYGPTLLPDGSRYFNKSKVEVMQPQGEVLELLCDELEHTYVWLKTLFPNGDDLSHILALLSYAYKAAYNESPKKTRAVFLVGPVSSGKSFFIDKFVPNIFGQDSAGDAHRLFKGEAGASSVLSSFVCKLSDKDVGTRADIARIQNGMLSLLADFTTGGRLLYEDVKTVEVINLFMLSSNPDGSVIRLLHGMPESVLDKLCIYECGGGFAELNEMFAEDAVDCPEEAYSLEVKDILAELPHFCSFLLHYDNKKYAEKRFGVTQMVPQKYKDLKVFSPKAEIVSELLQGVDLPFCYSSRIYSELMTRPSGPAILKTIGAHEFVDILTSISEKQPNLVQARVYSGGKNRKFAVTGKAFRANSDTEDDGGLKTGGWGTPTPKASTDAEDEIPF